MRLPIIALAASAALAAPASAVIVTLDFEGAGNQVSLDGFYNGGTDGAGNSGTNFGVNFSSSSLSIIDSDAGGSGNIANEPSGDTVLFFLAGTATLNYAAGFTTGFSFFYSSSGTAVVNVYDGLNATGNLLASVNLASQFNDGCVGDPNGAFCNFTAIGVTFAGTARSVDFGGAANFVAYDNVTFGSATPGGGGVPEPATWAMMIAGFGLVGAASRARRAVATA